eukprot:jgi/Orpsp1_1/1184817/evm.model.c7180000091086.1
MKELNIFENANLKDGFVGDRKYFKGFLAKMELIFMLYQDRFPRDDDKVVYIISRLYGQAMNWAATLIENRDPCLVDYEAFIERFKSFFGDTDITYVANQRLRTIKQKNLGGMRGYIMEFNKYADDSNWNEEAKMDAFIAGLNNQVATRILEMFPGPRNLLALQTIASRIDARLTVNQQFFRNSSSSGFRSFNYKKNKSNKYKNNKNNNKYHGPLSQEEKDRRRRENLCLYCGASNHSLKECPKSTIIPIKILVDSGSCYNLIDESFVKTHNIPITSIEKSHKIRGIGGIQTLSLQTIPVTIKHSSHIYKCTFFVTNLPSCNCILGFDWLRTHNPVIYFLNMKLSFKSNYCNSNCLLIPSLFLLSLVRTFLLVNLPVLMMN